MSTPKKYPEANPASLEQSQVAESVASYTISPAAATATLAAKSRRTAGLEAPDEVWEFAQKHRLVPHLETAVQLVKDSFHDIRNTYLTFEPDPEIPSLDGIAVNVKVGGTLDELLQQHNTCLRRFIKEIPNEFHDKLCFLEWGPDLWKGKRFSKLLKNWRRCVANPRCVRGSESCLLCNI